MERRTAELPSTGSFILLLHAHLPYVRHPEYEYSLEENWLFEAIRETYIPLLDLLERMANDRISPGITLSVSPTLLEMLNDEFLRDRFVRALDNLIELAESEKRRTRGAPFEPAAFLYAERFREARRLYLERYRRDLVSSFRKLQDEGHIEITATAATHAFLPAYSNYPEAVKAQVAAGIRSYVRNFGRRPAGFWLPECGYFKGLESYLGDAGIRYFFMESHGLIQGRPRPRYSIYRPVLTPSGAVVFGRDFRASQQVWCASSGYPGDPFYRDFYRDIGFDLPIEYIGRFTRLNGIRTFTGMKYHRITDKSKSADKMPYDRAAAVGRAAEHASHYTRSRREDFSRLSEFIRSPVIFSAFDAELFGHWWFEGTDWLDAVLRGIAGSKDAGFGIITPSEYLQGNAGSGAGLFGHPVQPAMSSWGEGGYNALWIGAKNSRLYRRLHRMAETMPLLMDRRKGGMLKRAVNQAMREMLLAQASDWLFLIEKERASEYAESRVMRHIENFHCLAAMVQAGHIDEARLKTIEDSSGAFAWLDADDAAVICRSSAGRRRGSS